MSHQELLNQFVDIVQLDNRELAEALLESTNWDLEQAVLVYLDDSKPEPQTAATNSTIPGPSAGQPVRPRPQPISLVEELNQELATDVAPRVPASPPVHEAAPGSIIGLAAKPLQLALAAIGRILRYFSWLNPLWPKLSGYSGINSSQRIGDPYDPDRVTARYIQWFEDTFGRKDMPFHGGSYLSALDQAKKDLRYLVVIIISPEHQDVAEAARVYTSDAFVDLITEKNMVLWSGSLADSEAYQLAFQLGATTYPYLGLVAPSPKTPQSSTIVMESLVRQIGYDGSSAEQLVRTLEDAMEQHSPRLLALQLERQQSTAARELRHEQDSAYERSLQADRARAAERQRAEQAREQAEQQRREAAASAAASAALLAAWKRKKTAELDALPETGECARVSIRLPSGERLVRKFPANAPIRTLYEFVLCHLPGESVEPAAELPPSFQPAFSFDLVSPMPRKAIALSDEAIRSESAIWPSGSLVVDEEE